MIEQSSNELKIRRELGFEPLQNEMFQNQSIRDDEREQSGWSHTRRESGRSLRALRARSPHMEFIVPLGITV